MVAVTKKFVLTGFVVVSFIVLRCPSLSFVVLRCPSSQQDTGAPKGENEEGAAGGGLSESVSGTAAREKLIQAEATRQRERRRALVNCNYHDRPELFDVGETSKEKKLRVLLSTSNPTQNALLKHLTAMHRDLTKKRGKRTVAVQWWFFVHCCEGARADKRKFFVFISSTCLSATHFFPTHFHTTTVLELLQEFPSKRLLLQYVSRFKNEGALGWHLHDHFSILYRDVVGIAKALMNLRRADYEYGRVEGRIRMLLNEYQHALTTVASLEADKAKESLDKIDKRRLGAAKAEMNRRAQRDRTEEESEEEGEEESGEESEEKRAARIKKEQAESSKNDQAQLNILVEKDEEELSEAELLLVEKEQELVAVKQIVVDAKNDVERLKKRLMDREHIVEITANDRISWNKRLTHCHSLPETNDTEIFQKYSEMAALFYDFKHCSQVYAETIVNELYLEQKSLKPVEWDVVDQLNSEETMLQRPRGLLTHNNQKKRPKWVVSNIRFKVAQDEHGVYNGK